GNVDKKGGDVIPQPVPARNIQLKERLPKDVQPITGAYPLFNEFHKTWGLHAQSCVVDAILEEKPYPIKMLVVQSGNPAVTMADSERVRSALTHLEFLVVIDLFMTRTANFADVILPASGCFEKTQLNRAYLRNNVVMLQDKVIEPIGASRPDWQITFELARRLGLEKEFPWQSVEEAIDYQLEPSGVTVDMLRKSPDGIRVRDMEYEKYKTKGFGTPTGRLEFYSAKLKKHGHLPVPGFEGSAKHPISFYDQKDEFPIIGISGARTNTFTHSQFKNIPSLIRHEPEGFIDIHPDDAREKMISDKDTVRVETPRGYIDMKARISDIVHPGSIRIGWGWGEINPDFNLNNLTDDAKRNDITCTPSSRSFMCRLLKLS
ncbi:MAG: molybdopterin-dependent oxidoreductase, partial [Proteobacteria bacterium]|nr:molybdopterin-dependent oxidoreductase [Pseudomonadota bacterium]